MIKEAIEKIVAMAAPQVLSIDGRQYRLRGYEPVLQPYPDNLSINNLTGIVDFCGWVANVEGWNESKFIHVRDYDLVVLYEPMGGPFNQRVPIVAAQARPCKFPFGKPLPVEEFIIALYSQFVRNDDRDYVIQMASNLKIDKSTDFTDNGVAQKITARVGVSSLVTDVVIRNPVTLRPFRTFTDIEQPESQFVFRFHKQNDMPLCSLHECDGETWKQEAILRIKKFFETTMTIEVVA